MINEPYLIERKFLVCIFSTFYNLQIVRLLIFQMRCYIDTIVSTK